jgi:hypothetical protein
MYPYQHEEWCEIPGYDGRYLISSYGMIKKTLPVNKAVFISLTPPTGKHHYISVYLHKHRKDDKTRFSLHSLVLLSFVGPRPTGFVSRHLDGNKFNNHISNLKYGTSHENSLDAVAHGTTIKGEKHHSCILKERDVISIKRKLKQGIPICKIAPDYPVARSTIDSIAQGVTWGWLQVDQGGKP